MHILHSYANGNTSVKIYSDGTKERSYDETPLPVHPESIDCKITNFCNPTFDNPICSYCHEKSGLNGKHADLDQLSDVLSELPAGVELAIGGGAPLSHPDIIPFLIKLKAQGIICNITINQKHLLQDQVLILRLINQDLISGIGISYSDPKYHSDIEAILKASDNVVFHMIMGINNVGDVQVLSELCKKNNRKCKILILGYKQFGFGIKYYLKNAGIEDNKYRWYVDLASYFKRDDMILSFDNLAIEQLKLKRYFTDTAWDKFFMGRDFVFTQYIDAVNQEYAPSSTSTNRVSFKDRSLLNYFQTNRNIA